MLQVIVPATESWDEANECFVNFPEQKLTLEHSLVSLSNWESKWRKPFISKDTKTAEETLDYIRCMTINENVDPEVYSRLTGETIEQIKQYIDEPMTATWFTEQGVGRGKASNRQITNELIYYWMISLQIPLECERWHLNRLLTLIRVCNIENQPPKQMSKRDVASLHRSTNARRRNARR